MILGRKHLIKHLTKFQFHWLLIAVLVVGTVGRLWKLTSFPPAIFIDEYNLSLAALRYWSGEQHIIWSGFSWYGTPELFVRTLANALAVFSFSASSLRIIWGVVGWLLLPTTYLLAKKMWGKVEALVASLLLSLSVFHIQISRWGHASVAMTTLFWLSTLGWYLYEKNAKWKYLFFSAICFVAGLYSYVGFRSLLIMPSLMSLVYVLRLGAIRNDLNKRKYWHQFWSIGLFWLVLLLLWFPQLLAGWKDPVGFWGRTRELSIFDPDQGWWWNLHQAWMSLLVQLQVFWEGVDPNLRHNPLQIAVYAKTTLVLILVGVIRSIKKSYWFELSLLTAATLASLAGAMMSGLDISVFRAQPILPVGYILAGVGLGWIWQWLKQSKISNKLGRLLWLMIVFVFFTQPFVRLKQYFHLVDGPFSPSLLAAFTYNEYLVGQTAMDYAQRDYHVYLAPDYYWYSSTEYELKSKHLWSQAEMFSLANFPSQIEPHSVLILSGVYGSLLPYFQQIWSDLNYHQLNNGTILVIELVDQQANLPRFGLNRRCQSRDSVMQNTGIDPTIYLAWPESEPLNAANFACEWSAIYQVTQPGEYRFQLLADDVAQMFIYQGGTLIADSGMGSQGGITVQLDQAEYQIKIEYQNLGGAKRVELLVKNPTQSSYQILSPLQLRPI